MASACLCSGRSIRICLPAICRVETILITYSLHLPQLSPLMNFSQEVQTNLKYSEHLVFTPSPFILRFIHHFLSSTSSSSPLLFYFFFFCGIFFPISKAFNPFFSWGIHILFFLFGFHFSLNLFSSLFSISFYCHISDKINFFHLLKTKKLPPTIMKQGNMSMTLRP